ncbi:uncharacterized protein RCC_05909 [Ramularia collo-cygni]|uniref:C2H2-type domain-containing protein n=1 Tax=Ramularia collo-cygni TaxID=112498 RepID=A0A2D3US20_9PEZI|nr:uncharacterized protein RCC_05909 [Ramularia collo-cygni]CZT20052.1 uncharacterized protein RCC_05909 [Ramularia collo-cygni]
MDSIIDALTRASTEPIPDSTKAKLLTVAGELCKLKIATAGILEQAQMNDDEEVSLQEFVGQLHAISRVAEEPMSCWLVAIGKALLVLGDVIAMPPPTLPSTRQASYFQASPAPRPAHPDLPAPQHQPMRQEVPAPDPSTMANEPEAEDEKLSARKDGEILDANENDEPALFGSDAYNNQPPSLLNTPTQPRAIVTAPEFKENDHHGGITTGKPSHCQRCRLDFPSRKRLIAHDASVHHEDSRRLWNATGQTPSNKEDTWKSRAAHWRTRTRERK